MSFKIGKLRSEVQNNLGVELIRGFEFNENYYRWGHNSRYWAIGSRVSSRGKNFYICTYGDFHRGDKGFSNIEKKFTWKSDYKFDDQINTQLKKLKEIHKIKKEDDFEEAKPKMLKKLEEVKNENFPIKDNNYVKKKNFYTTQDIIAYKENILFIKLKDIEGNFTGIQRIFLDPETKEFKKLFDKGTLLEKSLVKFGKLDHKTKYIFVCEGVATAGVVYKALFNQEKFSFCVFSSLTSKNLKNTIKQIINFTNNHKIVICADNDSTGISCALECRDLFENVTIKKPTKEGYDFADVANETNLSSVLKTIYPKKSDFITIKFLGITTDGYYYYSSYKNNILKIPINHTKPFVLDLAPASFWTKKFPHIEKDVIKGFVLDQAIVWLKENSIAKGQFNIDNLRGAGYFISNKKNKTLYACSGVNRIGEIDKNYFHISGKDYYIPKKSDYKPQSEIKKLNRNLEKLCWINPIYGPILLGWILAAPFAGALEFRPHIWITGSSTSGKSWIQDNIIYNMLKPFISYFTSGTTESGLRQSFSNNSMPFIYDEFEPTEDSRTKKVLEYLRVCSTGNKQKIEKGTPSGVSQHFSTSSMAVVSSIETSLFEEADKNRFFVLEFDKSLQKDQKDFNEFEQKLNDEEIDIEKIMIDHVNYTFFRFNEFYKRYRQFCMTLRNRKDIILNNHKVRAYSTVLAMLNLYDILKIEDNKFIEHIKNSYINESKENDCLDYLLNQDFRYDGKYHNVYDTVRIINATTEAIPYHERTLESVGVKYDKYENILIIDTGNPKLRATLMKNYPASNWVRIISRIKNITCTIQTGNYKKKQIIRINNALRFFK